MDSGAIKASCASLFTCTECNNIVFANENIVYMVVKWENTRLLLKTV